MTSTRRSHPRSRRWLVVTLALLLVLVTAAAFAWPGLVRRIAIARVHAITQRPVAIETFALAARQS